jgi:hypothetical protein
MNYFGLPTHSKDLGIAGINLGYGFSKFVLDGHEDSFMSVVTVCRQGIDNRPAVASIPLNMVTVDNTSYEVGQDAALAAWHEPQKLIARDWALSTQYRVLSKSIIQRMALMSKQRWRIYTGLAADHHKDAGYRHTVEQLWYGQNGVHHTPFGRVEIEAVKVIPETAGGFMSLMGDMAFRGPLERNAGVIIDFGRMTVNWVPFNLGTMDLSTVGSCDIGMSQVIDDLLKQLRPITRPTLNAIAVEAAIMGISPIRVPKTVHGSISDEVVPIGERLQTSIDEIWPRIFQQITNQVGNLQGKVVIAIGGGAQLFEANLKRSFPKTAVMCAPGGQFANARGLYAIAAMDASTEAKKSS